MENIALIDSFSEFKDDKLIDRVTLMAILEDVLRNALKKKYGDDDNFAKLSSSPYFFFNAFLNTSSKIAINVTRSINLSSLNSEKESINAIFSITFMN